MSRYYYADAKIFKWLRNSVFKVHKPVALGWGEWDTWEDNLKHTRPIAYFMTETLPDWAEWIPKHTIGYVDKLRIWISNYTNFTHGLRSTLPRGKWHEFEERVLYSLFDSFVEFIEIEEAWNHIIWMDEKDRGIYPTTKWYGIFGRKGKKWRCAKAGVDHLKWEMTLAEDGIPTQQATSALEKLTLYTWWKDVRPNRKDDWDESGLNAFWAEMDAKYEGNGTWLGLGSKSQLTAEEQQRYRDLTALQESLETRYAEEDDEMLLRLINMRKSLWT